MEKGAPPGGADKKQGFETPKAAPKATAASVLGPVLSCVTSFSPAIIIKGITKTLIEAVEPYLEKGGLQHWLSSSWIDDDNNAPYLATVQALAVRGGDNQLELLQLKQRAACLILERMEESLSKANDQARASLAVVLERYSYLIGLSSMLSKKLHSPFTPAFANDIAARLRTNLGPKDCIPMPLNSLLLMSTVAMAGQDLLHACLSIDPISGALEPEGL